jgi:phosphate transport system permease protein
LKSRKSEKVIETLLLLSAISSIGIVLLLISYLVLQGYPAIVNWVLHGFGMEFNSIDKFGIIPYIFSTIYVGLGATALAVAVGLPTAIYLAEFSRPRIRNFIKPSMETLSGMPSVVMGVVGFFYVAPIVFTFFYGYLCPMTAWIILAIMSLPFVISISEDALRAVPNSYREASQGLGATKWQTAVHIVLPEAKSGILAAILLSLASVLGETMAVWMLIGGVNTPPITLNPLVPSNVISSMIATYIYGSEMGQSAQLLQSLYGAGLILLVMIGMLNITVAMLAKNRSDKGE